MFEKDEKRYTKLAEVLPSLDGMMTCEVAKKKADPEDEYRTPTDEFCVSVYSSELTLYEKGDMIALRDFISRCVERIEERDNAE